MRQTNFTFHSFQTKLFAAIFVVVFSIFASDAAFGQVTPPTGIVGWYAGDGDFRDSSGNGNNATPATGANVPGFAVGRVGQAFNHNGAPQYATIPDSPALRPPSLTIEGWINLTGTAPSTVFAKPLGSGSFDSYVVFYSGGNINGAVCNNTGCITIGTPLTLNIWHHVAFSYDEPGGAATKTARLYLNGALVATNATGGAIGYDTRPAVIGADIENGSFQLGWRGRLDEITLYNRALSLTEIQSINTAGINGKTKQAATNAGANSNTVVGDATITFADVTTAGTTTDFTIAPASAGMPPTGYTPTGLAYDISTTAVFSGDIQVCFNLPALTAKINSVRILYRINNSLVDGTSSTNAATNTVCATVSSFSQFVIATLGVRQGQIIYSRLPASASDEGTIWAIYPNGTDDHFITTGTQPRLSPDGNYLAFKRKRSATTDPNVNRGVWILNLTTGAESEIFYINGDALVGFDFTPDSLKIVVDHSCSIYQMNLDGSNRTTLNGFCFDDAPTPRTGDGKLAFHSNSGIYTANANGSGRAVVPNTSGGDYYPFWSKDGQLLAYIHYDGSSPHPYYGDNLYKIKPDGTGKVLLKNLTGTDRFGFSGAWSADGTKIYMPARIGGVTGIYEVATDGSGTMSRAPEAPNLIAPGANVEFVGGVNGVVPTAGGVAVGGRVTTTGGRGIARARVTLTDAAGNIRATLTDAFGYYRFAEVAAGETYIFNAAHKRYEFVQATQAQDVSGDRDDINFIAAPQ